MHQSTRHLLFTALLLTTLAGCAGSYATGGVETAPTPPAPTKTKIHNLDELPVHTYALQGKPSEMLADPAAMATLARAVQADIAADLDQYLIEDVATLQAMHQTLATTALATGDLSEALAQLDKVRALEDKEPSRLMGGLVARTYIATARNTPPEGFAEAFKQNLTAALAPLPYTVVQDKVKGGKARAGYLSENLLLGVVQAQMDPAATAMGELSSELAVGLVGIRFAMDQILPLNPIVAEVYSEYLEANKVDKANIWPARDLVLSSDQPLTPVVIGIWDSGVDASVFGDRMFTNPDEKPDGQDTDGNGFVDDIHGIAYDLDGGPSTAILHPLGDQEGQLDDVYQYTQGFIDMTAAIDSPEATAMRTKMAGIAPAEVGDFMTTLGFAGLYMHGTHVAGLAARGNPFARILVARITFDYHPTPQAMTVATARRLAADYAATTRYFQAHGVRVVNMSWGWSFKEIEGGLAANGVGETGEERAEMARKMIDILSDGLHEAIAGAPDILFVIAAGNSDNDVEFDVVIPSSVDLPNTMVIGALDQAGDPTSFTSGGRYVKVYANGFQVESTVPGGGTMKMSGTSMASPNAANTAAKLIALKPDLKPAEIVALIEQGADPHPDHPEILRMNAKASAALIR